MPYTAGQTVTAGTLNDSVTAVIARAYRSTNSSGTTTEVGVVRLDDTPITAGRLYRVYTNSVGVDSSVANDGVRLNLRYTTDGTTPTPSSTVLTISQTIQTNIAAAEYVVVDATYTPASNETLSVLLTVSRATGSGTVLATGGSGAPGPIELYIEDMGDDPGDTGTEL